MYFLTQPGAPADKGDQEDDDIEMEELMHDREFLESVLSTLPGVNPEEALQNLEQMAEAEEDKKEKVGQCSVCCTVMLQKYMSEDYVIFSGGPFN